MPMFKNKYEDLIPDDPDNPRKFCEDMFFHEDAGKWIVAYHIEGDHWLHTDPFDTKDLAIAFVKENVNLVRELQPNYKEAEEGRKAHGQNLDLDENPYPDDTKESEAWYEGWIEADDNHRAHQPDE